MSHTWTIVYVLWLDYYENKFVDTNHPPDVNPLKWIPYALREKLKAELDKMVKMKIVQTVNEPTDWVNNLILVDKPEIFTENIYWP